MSVYCSTIFKRGKYFIETGTAQTFITWANSDKKITKYTPSFLIKRVADLMSSGDIDTAITLWMMICEAIDSAPLKIMGNVINFTFKVAIVSIVVYTILSTLF